MGTRDTQVDLRDTAPSEQPSRDASRDLDARLQRLVPGGAHTYAKGIDQFPEGMAPVLERGSGCHVWDVDGNEYIEFGMGLRAVTLGHGYPAVVDAIAAQLPHGTNFVRPSRLELEAAETFLGLVTRADMVKFTKDGSTANTAAVKLARAFTGRDLVALCVDHPFFSYDDWAMVATPVRGGIPASVEDLTLTFRYDDLASVEELLSRHPGEIACFILEPERASPPSEGYLQRLHELVAADGALLVLDENVQRVPVAHRGRAGGPRRHARSVDVGEGDRQRVRSIGTRRPARGNGARGARPRSRACLPPVHDARRGACRPRRGDRDDGDLPRRAGDRDASRAR